MLDLNDHNVNRRERTSSRRFIYKTMHEVATHFKFALPEDKRSVTTHWEIYTLHSGQLFICNYGDNIGEEWVIRDRWDFADRVERRGKGIAELIASEEKHNMLGLVREMFDD